MHDLIDTTEMYLRTVYELQEEGIVPMRARIAERLGQGGLQLYELGSAGQGKEARVLIPAEFCDKLLHLAHHLDQAQTVTQL